MRLTPDATVDAPSWRALRPLALWLLVLASGLGLLYARYDWDLEGGRFAKRGLVLSAYLLAILLPTCFYLAHRVLHNTPVAVGLTGLDFADLERPLAGR